MAKLIAWLKGEELEIKYVRPESPIGRGKYIEHPKRKGKTVLTVQYCDFHPENSPALPLKGYRKIRDHKEPIFEYALWACPFCWKILRIEELKKAP